MGNRNPGTGTARLVVIDELGATRARRILKPSGMSVDPQDVGSFPIGVSRAQYTLAKALLSRGEA